MSRYFYFFVSTFLLTGCATNNVQETNNSHSVEMSGYLMKSPSGIEITESELETAFRAAPPDAKKSIIGNGEKFMKFATNQYISKQLVDYAVKNKLDQDPQIIAQLQDYKNRLLSNAAVDHYISMQELPDFRELAYERYLIKKVSYKEPEQLHLAHILIRTGGKVTDSEAHEKASQIYHKAQRGDDFAALASEYSEDSSSAKGGDLGWVKRGQMIEAFEEAAFKLQKPGDVSNIIKTKFGYHIVKLIDRKPERQLAFDEVKTKIMNELESEHKKELQSQILLQYDISDQTIIKKDAISDMYVRLKKNLDKNLVHE